jgi:GTP-binding protein
MLLDLPGYGFAKSSKAKKKDWGPLLGEYFQKRRALAVVVIFMDIRHPLKESDWEMIHLCRNYNVPFIPALTKRDKLSNNNITKAISFVKGKIPESNPIAVSSKDKTGFDKLSKEILNSV